MDLDLPRATVQLRVIASGAAPMNPGSLIIENNLAAHDDILQM